MILLAIGLSFISPVTDTAVCFLNKVMCMCQMTDTGTEEVYVVCSLFSIAPGIPWTP